MNCFVIMPFSQEFDDVYAVIKHTVENATATQNGRCFRLDDACPAGRITDRLLNELRAATFCVADLTGSKPNVMWEVGFAMALAKPTILVIQSLSDLPFDIKDMQSIEYSRNHLNSSLATPLRRMIVDTLAGVTINNYEEKLGNNDSSEIVGTLLKEVAQLKEIVSEAVNVWKNNGSVVTQTETELESMCGHWFNTETGSHAYARVIHGELVVPYCFRGDDELTGVYYGWKRTGDYWFARYQWLERPISGFTFLKREAVDILQGAWWGSEDEVDNTDIPPSNSGVRSNFEFRAKKETPAWAQMFFEKIEVEGITSCLEKAKKLMDQDHWEKSINSIMY